MLDRSKPQADDEKKLVQIIQERVKEAEALLAKTEPKLFVWKSRSRREPLALQKILIRGMSAASKVRLSTFIPEGTIYTAGAKAAIGYVETYFEKTFVPSLTAKRGAAEGLSHVLVKDTSVLAEHRKNIHELRHHIQATIYAVSEYIEVQKITTKTAATVTVSPSKEKMITDFKDSHFRWRTSQRSLSVAMKLFIQQNSELANRVRRARALGSKDSLRLAQLNAVFAYEIADTIECFLRDFMLQGVPELRDIHEQMMTDMARSRDHYASLKNRYLRALNTGAFSKDEYERSMANIARRQKGLGAVERRWDMLVDRLKATDEKSLGFSRIIQRLEIIKEEAETNLHDAEITMVTGHVQENFVALGEMIVGIEQLEVEPITDEDINIYLDIMPDMNEEMPALTE